MDRFYITHEDDNGELHQLRGAWEAESPSEAIAQMLAESGGEDDGKWHAWNVVNETDVIA